MSNFVQIYIDKIKEFGFKPIAYTVMICEDTFVFETSEQAQAAYTQMEEINKGDDNVQGWYYGWDEFLKTLDQYKQTHGYINNVYWINYE